MSPTTSIVRCTAKRGVNKNVARPTKTWKKNTIIRPTMTGFHVAATRIKTKIVRPARRKVKKFVCRLDAIRNKPAAAKLSKRKGTTHYRMSDSSTLTSHMDVDTEEVATKGSLKKSNLVVVLDMDECLIHSEFSSPFSAKSTTREYERDVDVVRLPYEDKIMHVHKRPFLDHFLRSVSDRFETHIFTAATEDYAAPILDHLDPTGRMFTKRWYRPDCVHKDSAYVKDLTTLNTPLHRTVLVDNNPMSFCANPENGILVNAFYNDPKDSTLIDVMIILDALQDAPDVRVALREFSQPSFLRAFRSYWACAASSLGFSAPAVVSNEPEHNTLCYCASQDATRMSLLTSQMIRE